MAATVALGAKEPPWTTQTGESGGSGPALLSCALKPKPEARQGVRTLTLRETEAHSQSLRHHLEIPVSRRRAPSSHAAPGLEKSSSQSVLLRARETSSVLQRHGKRDLHSATQFLGLDRGKAALLSPGPNSTFRERESQWPSLEKLSIWARPHGPAWLPGLLLSVG